MRKSKDAFADLFGIESFEIFKKEVRLKISQEELAPEEILTSQICREKCFQEVIKNGFLTAEEQKTFKKIKPKAAQEYLRKNARIVQNVKFDLPQFITLSSGFSFQCHHLRIPSARMQLSLLLLEMILTQYTYKISPRFSFGPFSKKPEGRLQEIITEKLNEGKWSGGFTARFDITSSKRYRKLLDKYLPFPRWLTDKLVKSRNLSVRTLGLTRAGLTGLPDLERIVEELWLGDLMAAAGNKDRKLIIVRDWLLVLVEDKDKLQDVFEEVRKVLPGFALDFDYDTVDFFDVADGFKFQGKRYFYSDREVTCLPDRRILDSFLEYVYRVMHSPLPTLPAKEKEFNRLILILNLFYQGLPQTFLKEYQDIILAARFIKKSSTSFKEIKNEALIEEEEFVHVRLKKTACPGLDDILTRDDFKENRARIWRRDTDEENICPICGKKICPGDRVVSLITDKTQTVHSSCNDNAYAILSNLLFYPGLLDEEWDRLRGISIDPNKAEKIRRPEIKSSWEYYPLYYYFSRQKKKIIRHSFEELDTFLGFKIPEKLRDIKEIQINKGRHLQPRDTWLQTGYRIKETKQFKGKITFERTEPNLKPVTTHPLTKVEVTSEIQKEFNSCLRSLIDSKRK